MKQVESVGIDELKQMAQNMYGSLVKAVVDLDQKLLVVDAEMHVDMEQYLLEHGSQQGSLWGINLYPDAWGSDTFIEYDSMINIRPRSGNMSRSVDDPATREKIKALVEEKVHA